MTHREASKTALYSLATLLAVLTLASGPLVGATGEWTDPDWWTNTLFPKAMQWVGVVTTAIGIVGVFFQRLREAVREAFRVAVAKRES